jgi:selenocysteine lyase/cysteine desulfurase
MLAAVHAAALRAAFPVLSRVAYLNAGSCGPLPLAAHEALVESSEQALAEGRAGAYFERTIELQARLRAVYAERVGADADDVALTTSTSDGIVRVLAGLDLREGDEVLTGDEEHPGLLGPLAAARAQRGIAVRAVPLAELPDAIGPRTKLVACSHVGWLRGDVVPSHLAEAAGDVPVLLDGAQGAGAVPVDVGELGCAFYAAAGQKWLCGPIGTGLLYVAPAWRERLPAAGPTFVNLEVPMAGLDAVPHAGARAYDASALPAELTAAALAAHRTIATFGWPEAHERAAALAADLAGRLLGAGRTVAPGRGRTTLVAWEDPEPQATRDRLAAAGIVLRDLPGTPYLRASVGAWNDESDLERLLAAL